jgi:glycosyltransferase involved in cell wall biosynthesis
MKASLYHPWVYLRGGAERVLLELLDRSRHDWTLYTHHFAQETTFDGFADHHVVELGPRVSVRRSLGPLLHATATIARTRLPTDGARALLVSTEGLGDLVLARAGLPALAYCHTPLKILHDRDTNAALRAGNPVKAALAGGIGPAFRAADSRLWRRYQHVFANSAETSRRILGAGLASPDRVETLFPGVDTDRFGSRWDELGEAAMAAPRDPIFLVAGRIQWQKNIELALDAVRLALVHGFRGRLVIAGAVDEKSRPYLARLRELAGGLPVTFEIDPTDARLEDLYCAATALLFTARNEDFGIVPLEAMACGAAVLAVDNGGPRETVLHDRTGWLLPPDPAAFALQLLGVEAMALDMGRLRGAARLRAQDFSWRTMVDRLDHAVEAVAEGMPVPRRSVALPDTRGAVVDLRAPVASGQRG